MANPAGPRIDKAHLPAHWLSGGGEMGRLVRSKDWSRTPLGAPESWPQSLRTMLGALLGSRFPMLLWWGPDLLHLYNDAYRPILRDKHPASLGAPAAEVWAEVWDIAGPMARSVLEGGPATWTEDLQLFIKHEGFTEETYFTFSYSPVPGDDGRVAGVLNTVHGFGEEAGKALTEHPAIKAIGFVGESATGSAIMAQGATGMTSGADRVAHIVQAVTQQRPEQVFLVLEVQVKRAVGGVGGFGDGPNGGRCVALGLEDIARRDQKLFGRGCRTRLRSRIASCSASRSIAHTRPCGIKPAASIASEPEPAPTSQTTERCHGSSLLSAIARTSALVIWPRALA